MNNFYQSPDYIRAIKSRTRRDVFIDSCYVGGGMFFALLIQTFAPLIIMLFPGGSPIQRAQSFSQDIVAVSLISGLSMLVPYAIVAAIKPSGVKYSYTPKKVNPAHCLLLLFGTLGVLMLTSLIVELLETVISSTGVSIGGLVLNAPDGRLGKTLFCFCIAAIPAVCEEFAFRVVSLNILRKYSEGFAVLMTAALFGLMHGNFEQIPFAFVCGLALGYITIKTGSVLLAMAAHFCNNLLSAFMSVLGISRTGEYIVVSVLIALGAVAVILLKKSGFDFRLKKSRSLPISKAQLGAIFFVSPFTLVSALITLGLAVSLVVIL